MLQENLVEKSCGTGRREKANLRKAVIGGNLAFLWEILQEILAGK